ncbi:DUF4093 domain-containing protein, partial [Staphylococcus epidermidis]|uniref:DUF4093 domain-containing protein n=1 Tax=Staphylococcus epidermidis TaxID=1282 RepID=UPI0011A7FDA5
MRNTIRQHLSPLNHPYLHTQNPNTKTPKIPIQHPNIKHIQQPLIHLTSPLQQPKQTIHKTLLIHFPLIIPKHPTHPTNILPPKLHIPHSNPNQLLNKLNPFAYTQDD